MAGHDSDRYVNHDYWYGLLECSLPSEKESRDNWCEWIIQRLLPWVAFYFHAWDQAQPHNLPRPLEEAVVRAIHENEADFDMSDDIDVDFRRFTEAASRTELYALATYRVFQQVRDARAAQPEVDPDTLPTWPEHLTQDQRFRLSFSMLRYLIKLRKYRRLLGRKRTPANEHGLRALNAEVEAFLRRQPTFAAAVDRMIQDDLRQSVTGVTDSNDNDESSNASGEDDDEEAQQESVRREDIQLLISREDTDDGPRQTPLASVNTFVDLRNRIWSLFGLRGENLFTHHIEVYEVLDQNPLTTDRISDDSKWFEVCSHYSRRREETGDPVIDLVFAINRRPSQRRSDFAQRPASASTTDPDEVMSENVLSVPRTVADIRRLLRVSRQVVGPGEILSHGDIVSPEVLNQALNTLEGSQAAREGADGDQTESAVVPSWFRQLTIQNVQGMLDQAAASYNISEAEAIANLRERRGFSDDDEDNIIFRVPGRRGRSTVLKPHQRIYMDWALAMEIKYGSAVNGDGCGLGKTIMCVAHILNATEYWLQQSDDLQEHRPTLIVCPNNIAKKWTKTARSAVDGNWQVWRYGPNASKKDSVRTCRLDRGHEAFTHGPRNIVIMTMQELSNISAEEVPHLRYLFGRVCVDESQGFRHALKTKKGMTLVSFCARFRHCYTATICYDSLHDINGHLAFLERAPWTENRDWNAYKHGNPRFGENALYTEARRLWNPEYSYSPDPEVDVDMDNVSEDSYGPEYEPVCRCIPINYNTEEYADKFLQHRGRCQSFPHLLRLNNREDSVEARFRQNEEGKRYSEDGPPFPFNPFNTFSALNRNIVQCATVRAFSYYIAPRIDRALKDPSAKEDISVAADRVKKIFDLLVLARGHSTTVVDRNGNTVRCGEGIPPATTATVDLRFSEEEQAEYRRREQDAGCRLKWQELIRDLHLEKTAGNLDDVDLSASARPKTPPKFATRRGRAIAHGRKYAFMTTLPSHLGMTAFKGLSLAWFRSRRDWSLAQLVQFMKDKGALNPADRDTPLDTPEEVVRQFLWGAPKFRYALQEAERVLFTDAKPVGHRKLADFCQSPKTQELLLKLYEYVGIRCLCIDSSVTASTREEMIEDFNTKDDHQILLTTYTINIAGQDLHPKCCTSLFMECAYGWAAEHQAGCRTSRFGQEHDVEITRLFVRDTYNEVQEYRILAKAAPYFESQSSNLLEQIRANVGNNKMDGYNLVAKFMGMARTRIKSARREDREQHEATAHWQWDEGRMGEDDEDE
ncbi:hypothetical protein KC340_g6162 [Hortaea werneckii]|nr:hypothetical protein KC342_g3419 [Hortaea werneckii]KAI7099138.1 hypothetical protein KC339_g8450 [Hortaea werneckii]KAI7239473.1 hypothetical protein KC365_g4089 [Hortaea werneckii]KAI7325263.1 hypothetical protein KC340_g6162 [Hortaea werneckii]KAI7385706.1 hypothetical protein KC328_g10206 [Hortaea werneckii]